MDVGRSGVAVGLGAGFKLDHTNQRTSAPLNPVYLSEVEDRIWRLTNDVRRQHGLSSLSRDSVLWRVSQDYAKDMLVRCFFSHTNPEGLRAGERLKPFYSSHLYAWGENIWEGINIVVSDPEGLAHFIMNAWMSSPGHRQNILSPEYTCMGIGVAAGGREIRATQLFAKLEHK